MMTTYPKIIVNADTESNNKQLADLQVKYKTEICRNWENGECMYGGRCAFAHGDNELRLKTHITANYKTKRCRQFYELGYCSYGQRCQFIHCEYSASRSTSPSPSPEDRMDSHRLPVFVRIAQKEQDK